ncbi:hypothetical protein AVEN_231580-1 [Araneus ventricosus]|uniref:C2H2-type domain-containing protein n=1 Tax=Araneus ventricosus TaxID=182803 RepID=A0A4Y2IJF5_ARAVE|nr:hypothetical protein AVEN_231580-1 [Araneus ventricosus]
MRIHTREKNTHPCEHCDQVFPRMSDLLRHKRTDHSAPPAHRVATPRARKSGRKILGVYSSHFMTPSSDAALDLLLFLEEVRPQIHGMIVDELEETRPSNGTESRRYASAWRLLTDMWSIAPLTSAARCS